MIYPVLMEMIPISKFKATCLAVLEEVRRSGQPVLVTRRGEPIAEIVPPSRPASPESWLGAARGTGRIIGDLVEPVAGSEEWEALTP
jgi:prevent-host-death family protein